MPVSLETLKAHEKDYLLAYWENGGLVMEPHCFCGAALEEDYFCGKCSRKCKCKFIACQDPQALTVVQKLLCGNPNFRDYEASLLGE